MQSIMRCLGIVLIGALVLANTHIARATPLAPATVYLPLIRNSYTLFNNAVGAIDPVAQAGLFNTPYDATPDPDANKVYFTAQSVHGADVFSVPANGGAVVSITVGAPFTLPLGLAMSSDGQRVYVADPKATGNGAIFSVTIAGGMPKAVAGTQGTAPRGLEVAQENGVDTLYFTGVNPSDGTPAVMEIPATGGVLSIIAKGAPLVNPVGVAISKNGTVYVTDATASNGLGQVFRIKGGQVDTLADHVDLGNPAGIALTLDESLLLVSALDATLGTAQVLVINLANQQQGIVNKVIGVNHASGGLHRAHNRNVMAWADLTGGPGGRVYRINFP